MSEGLHDPTPIQRALAATSAASHAGDACASCGMSDDNGDVDFHLLVLPLSNGTHATPQLSKVCDPCAMEIAEALSELGAR